MKPKSPEVPTSENYFVNQIVKLQLVNSQIDLRVRARYGWAHGNEVPMLKRPRLCRMNKQRTCLQDAARWLQDCRSKPLSFNLGFFPKTFVFAIFSGSFMTSFPVTAPSPSFSSMIGQYWDITAPVKLLPSPRNLYAFNLSGPITPGPDDRANDK
jgi:hypothetical protein